MQHLDRLQPERSDAVEDPLAGPEQDRGDVERELVDDPGGERLPNSGGAARDVHAVVAGRLTRLRVGGVEAVGDEVEGRPALHLDRLVGVMGEHDHRCVIRRLGPPPAAPVLLPLTADRPEHVAAHDVGAARAHEPADSGLVGLVGALVAEVPAVELPSALPKRVLATLVRSGDETVERDRHVAGGVRHRDPSEGVDDLSNPLARTGRWGSPGPWPAAGRTRSRGTWPPGGATSVHARSRSRPAPAPCVRPLRSGWWSPDGPEGCGTTPDGSARPPSMPPPPPPRCLRGTSAARCAADLTWRRRDRPARSVRSGSRAVSRPPCPWSSGRSPNGSWSTADPDRSRACW